METTQTATPTTRVCRRVRRSDLHEAKRIIDRRKQIALALRIEREGRARSWRKTRELRAELATLPSAVTLAKNMGTIGQVLTSWIRKL